MAFTFLHRPSLDAEQDAVSELLGAEAPLTRASASLSGSVDQLAAALVILALTALWLAAGEAGAVELAAAGAGAVLVLACRTALLVLKRNELMLELILRGEVDVPLVAMQRLRRRLLDPRARRRLARTLTGICSASAKPPYAGGIPVNAPVIRAVHPELDQVISLLCSDRVGVRGAAHAFRLVTGPGSALYGSDVRALREELNQVRYWLSEGS